MIKTKNWQYTDWIEYYFIIKSDDMYQLLDNCKSLDELKNQAKILEEFCKVNFGDKRKKDLIEALRQRYYKAGRTKAGTYQEFIDDIETFQNLFWKFLESEQFGMMVELLQYNFSKKKVKK